MKILFLLFPFFLLFLQGTAGNDIRCRIEGGRCRYGGCQFAEKQIGKCFRYGVDALNAVSRMSPSLLAPGNSSRCPVPWACCGLARGCFSLLE
ncbi:gallinacin-3-like [Aythya fuligula]|uniref:Gallinacin-3-like n=1 Tax=Aythya fuligula TaxID=219594 RepID=A0A6J3CMY7_AYTFU|nr:gallinacin-3-like [Aythya fuligula]